MAILNRQTLLERFDFWKNKDWDWYKENIPFFDCPDPSITEIYYFRWQLVTQHLKYVSPQLGYMVTEFNNLQRLGWAGAHNSICGSCEHHIAELRWLHNPQYALDWIKFWFKAEGAQPTNYTWSAAHTAWALYQVVGDPTWLTDLLPGLIALQAKWKEGRVDYPHDNGYNPQVGLFWNTGRDSATEYNLASTQLNEELRGIPGYKIRGGAGYRPDCNANMYADLLYIGKIAALTGQTELADDYYKQAQTLKKRVQELLWDPKRSFFLHRWHHDEYSQKDEPGSPSIQANSLIWETNRDRFGGVGHQPHEQGFAHGRELIGYLPWRYNLPDRREETGSAPAYAKAWQFLMDPDYFFGQFGPTSAERHDPWFSIIYGECRWNGDSWPYNTSRTLEAAANLLNNYPPQNYFTRSDYFKLFKIYTATHYKDGQPYLAESHDPDRPAWTVDRLIGYDYFHSNYTNLIITGLGGLRLDEDESEGDSHWLMINPLFPPDWDYFILEDVPYQGYKISIIWDRRGEHYQFGRGLHVLADGDLVASTQTLENLKIKLLPRNLEKRVGPRRVINYAVNNTMSEYPKLTASFTAPGTELKMIQNGLYWYHSQPVNRWTSEGSGNSSDWIELDFGEPCSIEVIKLYLYEDKERQIVAPWEITLEEWIGDRWQPFEIKERRPLRPMASRANTFSFVPHPVTRVRITLFHLKGQASGIVELEAVCYV